MTDVALDLEHPSPDAKPLARVYGEAFNDLPFDLYIPPDALEVFLESFEGPLDLLLYLIRKQNINVLDIPMAELTQQYLGYVEMMRRTQLELAAEYLLMAAVLIEIKSRLLLPKPPAIAGRRSRRPARRTRAAPARIRADEAGGARDRRDAAGRPRFRDGPHLVRPRRVAARLPDVSPDDLKAAWAVLIQRAHINRHHLVSREQLSVRSEMSRILKLLAPSRYTEFTALFAEHADIAHLVVTFLAMLELAREQLVSVAQAEPYAPIYVQLKASRPSRWRRTNERRSDTAGRRAAEALKPDSSRRSRASSKRRCWWPASPCRWRSWRSSSTRRCRRHRAQAARRPEAGLVRPQGRARAGRERLALPGRRRPCRPISTGCRRKSRRAIRAR